MSKKIKILLTLSLVLNILCIGLIGGHIAKFSKYGKHPILPMLQASKELPELQDAKIQAQLKTLYESHKANHKAIHNAREKLLNIFTSKTFDPAAYEETTKEMAEMHQQMRENMTNTIKDIAVTLNQRERVLLANQLRKFRPHKMHRKHRNRD